MSQRYHVHDGERLVAVIHAEDAEGAILVACKKVDRLDPKTCTAHLVMVRTGNRAFGSSHQTQAAP